MIGTILSITDDILFNPPAIVKKHVIPNTITASKGLIPNASFREFTTDSVCTQHVHGPRTKQQIASKKAPFFHPSAFFITSPIRKLTDGILEIANHNYEKRLDLGDNQEFAEVASSFNRMAERLTEYRKSTLADIIQAKKYIEAIVNSITEPIIGLDRDRSILFANDEALTILNLKQEIIKYLEENNIEYKDFGCDSTDSTDYPIYAKRVAIAIQNGDCEKGILICGTGIGISITANKFKGIRAALCSDCFSAEATRLHNNANILAMGGRVVGPGLAVKIVDTFLNTPFSEEERHIRRIKQIEEDTDITDAYPEI